MQKQKTVRIMDRDAWIIQFHKTTNTHVPGPGKADLEGRIRGAMPESLDSNEIWKMCKKYKEDAPEMGCCCPKGYKDKLFSCAVINVRFPSKIIGDTYCYIGNELIKAVKKGTLKSEEIKTIIDDTEYHYADFLEDFQENQKLHNKKKLTDEEKKKKKATYKKTSKLIRSLSKYNTIGIIREEIYKNGFTVQTDHGVRKYVLYKRSASKAKSGSCLFIWDELYDDMISWTWLGLPIKEMIGNENFNLTSARAYEALVQSSIEKTVKIDPGSILLIESVESPNVEGNTKILTIGQIAENASFQGLCSEEEYEGLHGHKYDNRNIIWDGQALLDESIFEDAGYTGNDRHGMMLLRNSFFKACSFNTKISAYYKEKGVETVTDMFGKKIKASDVKMIVTPDSIKLFKFSDVFFDGNDKKAYEYWKSNISCEFGVVKVEHASHLGHGQYHEVGYQVLNTLPLREEDIRELLKDDLTYLDLLKNNSSVLLHRLRYIDKSMRKKYFIYNFYKYFKDFKETKYFKDFLNEELDDYKKNLKMGRLKLKGDFYVLASMPLEMLEYSVRRNRDDIKPRLNRGEVYISGRKDGENVTLFRYPHISSGSVCSLVNRDIDDYNKWFNLDTKYGSRIVVVSPWNSNIMRKLGGADFDSDTALFIEDETIQKAAKELMEIDALNIKDDGLPVGVADDTLKSSGTNDYYNYEPKHMAALDNKLSRNSTNIGSLSNYAQIYNSLFWEEYFKGKNADAEKLRIIYDHILQLSILNELEIDSAKHKLSVDLENIKNNVINAEYNGEILLKNVPNENGKGTYKRIACPYFLYMISIKKGNKNFGLRDPSKEYKDEKRHKKEKENKKYWNCPMDFIAKILIQSKNESREGTDLMEFLKNTVDKSYKKGKPNPKHIAFFETDVLEACEKLDELNSDRDSEKEEREKERQVIQEDCMEKIFKKRISEETKLVLFERAFDTYESTKDGHKKGEYKHPNEAKHSKTYMGFIFAKEECDKKEEGNGIPAFLKPDCERKELINPYDFNKLPAKEKKKWDKLTLWGEDWYSYNVM